MKGGLFKGALIRKGHPYMKGLPTLPAILHVSARGHGPARQYIGVCWLRSHPFKILAGMGAMSRKLNNPGTRCAKSAVEVLEMPNQMGDPLLNNF